MKKRPVLITIYSWFLIVTGIIGIIASIPIISLYVAIHNGGFLLKDKDKIIAVSPNSPAAQAHLQPGDSILSIQGATMTDASQVVNTIQRYKGQSVQLTVEHNGVRELVSIIPRVNPPIGQGDLGIVVGSTYKVSREPMIQVFSEIILKGYTGYEYTPTQSSAFSLNDRSLVRLRALLFGVADIVIGIGFLKMKLWAFYSYFATRIVYFILSIPSLMKLPASLTAFGNSGLISKTVIPIVIGYLIEIYIWIYLYRNKARFK